jgi:N6-L-threonylcarbamoyladenine synthase
LRDGLAAVSAEHGLRLHVPPRNLCTDNAAMIAAAGTARLAAGERAGMDLNAIPDLPLERSEAPSGRAKPGSPRVQ